LSSTEASASLKATGDLLSVESSSLQISPMMINQNQYSFFFLLFLVASVALGSTHDDNLVISLQYWWATIMVFLAPMFFISPLSGAMALQGWS
jgi:hypothetical protein